MRHQGPERIGRFEILGELGRGSMGRVYLALDPNIDRKVAIKVLDPVGSSRPEEEEELRRRFVLEARAAGRVNHPGIVTVYDASAGPDGTSFIAMEWVDGPSLDRLVAESGPLPVERAVDIAVQVAEALDAAHAAGLVHRDVKPANVLLDRSGRARISDFGIAKFTTMSNTATGRILGSPFYMAPEQVRNDPVDHRADIFSLGIVLYQLLSGVSPFGGDSLASVTYRIIESDPEPIRRLNAAVSPRLAAVIERALAKDPAARFQSAAAFARALEETIEPSGDSTHGPTGTLILDGDRSLSSAGGSGRIGARLTLGVGWLLLLVPVLLATFVALSAPDGTVPGLTVSIGRPGHADGPGEGGTEEPAAPGTDPPAAPTEPDSGDEPAPEATEPEATVFRIEYRNRLKSGTMTVLIDDREVWSRALRNEGLRNRIRGSSVRATIPVPVGRHVVEVRISGSEGTVRARKRIWGTFESDASPGLRVVLVPPRVIRLSWK